MDADGGVEHGEPRGERDRGRGRPGVPARDEDPFDAGVPCCLQDGFPVVVDRALRKNAVVVVSLAVLVWLVVMALGDAWRRRDIDRATKAAWTLLVVLVPLAGVSAYLIANGEGMARRKAESKRTR